MASEGRCRPSLRPVPFSPSGGLGPRTARGTCHSRPGKCPANTASHVRTLATGVSPEGLPLVSSRSGKDRHARLRCMCDPWSHGAAYPGSRARSLLRRCCLLPSWHPGARRGPGRGQRAHRRRRTATVFVTPGLRVAPAPEPAERPGVAVAATTSLPARSLVHLFPFGPHRPVASSSCRGLSQEVRGLAVPERPVTVVPPSGRGRSPFGISWLLLLSGIVCVATFFLG